MQRAITGFTTDDEGHHKAVLDCHHGFHMRHDPPMVSRPWVLSEESRQQKIGTLVDCLKCDRLEFPEGLEAYKSTPWFTEDTVPAGLTKDHTTKAGVWARIVVAEGRLRYVVQPPVDAAFLLEPGTAGIVAPLVPHHVSPQGPVRFQVVFHRGDP